MSSEFEKRAPGAKDIIKKHWWRPLAIAVITASSGLYNKENPPDNPSARPNSPHTLTLDEPPFFLENRQITSPVRSSNIGQWPEFFPEVARQEAVPDQEVAQEYTVQSGDYLSKISKEVYGTEEYWRVLSHVNEINNPNILYVGTKLTIPPQGEAESIMESLPPIQEKPISRTPVLQTASAPSTPTQLTDGELSRITGYYCQQVPGYYIGDGGGFCGNTASGEPVRSGIAACGYKWQLGTKLYIEGYGVIQCLDRGNLGHKQVDIWFPTNKDMIESGKPEYTKVAIVE